MKLYNVKCPLCGTVNRGLDLEETHHWFECTGCHEVLFAATPDMKMTEAKMISWDALKKTTENA